MSDEPIPNDREILEHLVAAEQWTARPDWITDLTVMGPFAQRMLALLDGEEAEDTPLVDPAVLEKSMDPSLPPLTVRFGKSGPIPLDEFGDIKNSS